MNMIALKIVQAFPNSEEKAFWVLVQTVECFLPVDYYSNLVGCMVDQRIMYQYFKDKVPEVERHLQSLQYDPSLLGF